MICTGAIKFWGFWNLSSFYLCFLSEIQIFIVVYNFSQFAFEGWSRQLCFIIQTWSHQAPKYDLHKLLQIKTKKAFIRNEKDRCDQHCRNIHQVYERSEKRWCVTFFRERNLWLEVLEVKNVRLFFWKTLTWDAIQRDCMVLRVVHSFLFTFTDFSSLYWFGCFFVVATICVNHVWTMEFPVSVCQNG